MREDWFLGQLDFLGFYCEAQDLFGAERVTPFLYSGDTVGPFLTHYAIGQQHPVQAAEAAHRENIGLSTAGSGSRISSIVGDGVCLKRSGNLYKDGYGG